MSEQTNVPIRVAALLSLVAQGDVTMVYAKEMLRRWYAVLPPEERKGIADNNSAIGRKMVACAEGLAQELAVLAVGQ